MCTKFLETLANVRRNGLKYHARTPEKPFPQPQRRDPQSVWTGAKASGRDRAASAGRAAETQKRASAHLGEDLPTDLQKK